MKGNFWRKNGRTFSGRKITREKGRKKKERKKEKKEIKKEKKDERKRRKKEITHKWIEGDNVLMRIVICSIRLFVCAYVPRTSFQKKKEGKRKKKERKFNINNQESEQMKGHKRRKERVVKEGEK